MNYAKKKTYCVMKYKCATQPQLGYVLLSVTKNYLLKNAPLIITLSIKLLPNA